MLVLGLIGCASQPEPGVQQAPSSSADALKKISYQNAEELQRLRDSGAEIIVQQENYVIVRTDSQTLSAFAANAAAVQEQDLIQRLVHVQLRDAGDVQLIVDAGADLWEVKSDTAIVRAFDIQLERLRKAGVPYRLVKQDASEEEGRQ
jgi:hypothetical protein